MQRAKPSQPPALVRCSMCVNNLFQFSAVRSIHIGQLFWPRVQRCEHSLTINISGGSRGGARGAWPLPPYFQTTKKKIFTPDLPYLRVWMTTGHPALPPPFLGEGLDSPLKMTYTTSYIYFSIMNAGFEKAYTKQNLAEITSICSSMFISKVSQTHQLNFKGGCNGGI